MRTDERKRNSSTRIHGEEQKQTRQRHGSAVCSQAPCQDLCAYFWRVISASSKFTARLSDVSRLEMGSLNIKFKRFEI